MLKFFTVALLALVVSVPCISKDDSGNGNPGVLPPSSHYRGLSYGEWAAMWRQTALLIPVVDGSHPVISGGAFEGSNGVLFLAASSEVSDVIEITVGPGTPIFVPIVTFACSVIEPDPFHGDDEESLGKCANAHLDSVSGLFAEVDGKALVNLESYRVTSPVFEIGPLPEGNLLQHGGADAPEGTVSQSVSAGIYLMLVPFSVGEHAVRVGGVVDGAAFDTTFIITVVAKKK